MLDLQALRGFMVKWRHRDLYSVVGSDDELARLEAALDRIAHRTRTTLPPNTGGADSRPLLGPSPELAARLDALINTLRGELQTGSAPNED